MDALKFLKDPWTAIAIMSFFIVTILWIVWRTSPEGWARHYVRRHDIQAGDMLKTSYGVLKFQHIGNTPCYYVSDGKILTKLHKNMVSGPIGKDTALIRRCKRGSQTQKWKDARSVFATQRRRASTRSQRSVLEQLGYTGRWWKF